MKTKHSRALLSFLLVILFTLLATSNFAPSAFAAQNVEASQQETPTPPAQDGSEIGSTDGILIMGVVIVLIVTVPVILRKKK